MVEPEPVSARDLAVADRIARAVRRGPPADRRPTLDQVLAAFGATEPTLEARRRAARALALAGVATVPDLLEAAPGQRVALEVRGPRTRHPLLAAALAFVAVLGAAAALASTLDTSSTERVPDLPSVTETPMPPTPTQTATEPAATTPQQPSAAERRRQQARARRARARRRVTVGLTASQATFLCVEGDGRQLFSGTLSGSRSFRARVIRLNVGLGPTTRVTANGRAVPLTTSPTGVQITATGHSPLPSGARPCA